MTNKEKAVFYCPDGNASARVAELLGVSLDFTFICCGCGEIRKGPRGMAYSSCLCTGKFKELK
jgi:hypothetical protein